jgi:hypothetical protein
MNEAEARQAARYYAALIREGRDDWTGKQAYDAHMLDPRYSSLDQARAEAQDMLDAAEAAVEALYQEHVTRVFAETRTEREEWARTAEQDWRWYLPVPHRERG